MQMDTLFLYTEIAEASVMMEALSEYIDICNDENDIQLAMSVMQKIYISMKALDNVHDENDDVDKDKQ